MDIVLGQRQTGRTTKMIEWLRADPNRILVVHNEAEAQRLRDLCDHDGIMELSLRIVPANLWMRRLPSFHLPTVAIDNADLVLEQLFGKVEIVTMTHERETAYGH